MDKEKVFLVSPKQKQSILENTSPVMQIMRQVITENPNVSILVIDDIKARHNTKPSFYKDKILSARKLPFDYGNVYFASNMEEFYADFYDYMSEISDSVYPDCDDKELEEIYERLCIEYEKQFEDVFVIKI